VLSLDSISSSHVLSWMFVLPTTTNRTGIMEKSITPDSSASAPARTCVWTKAKGRARRHASSFQRPPDPRVGTRSVNTLSAAQLARKRANDREAQRVNRQRTREHIENLERQVTELSKQKGHLHKVLQRNSDLKAQIAVLRRQFTDMALLLQYRQTPSVQSFTDADPAYGTSTYSIYFSTLSPTVVLTEFRLKCVERA
jgi:hypothetical protein